jgi:hypothetical protein
MGSVATYEMSLLLFSDNGGTRINTKTKCFNKEVIKIAMD